MITFLNRLAHRLCQFKLLSWLSGVKYLFALLLICPLASFALDGTPGVRAGESLTLLPNGQILLAGGYNKSNKPTSDLAIEDQSGHLKALPNGMRFARAGHTATVLPDGQVLIFGGYGSDGKLVSTGEILDASSGQTTEIQSFRLLPRAFHTSTVLTDGTLLVAGGVGQGGQLTDDVQTWDYRTGTTLAYHAALSVPRQKHTATLLPNGNVLLSGGLDQFGKTIKVAEEYDVNSHSFSVSSPQVSDSQPQVADSIPTDGEENVQITNIIGVRFASPMSVMGLNTSNIVLRDSSGNPVQTVVSGVENGRLVFVVPSSPLQFGMTYLLTLDQLVDLNGQLLDTKTIQFTTQDDPQDSSDEEWIPGAEDFNGQWHSHTGPSEWQKLPPLKAPNGITALAGQVLRLNGRPLAHALLQVDNQHVYSDTTGRFLLSNIVAGHHVLIIDGRAANRTRVTYGLFEAGIDIAAGKTNVLNYTIWMTKLDMAHAANIPSPTTAPDTIITTPRLPGLELHLPQNTVIVDHDGHPVHQLTITAVPLDKPPFPLPPGVQVPIYFTIQPGGAYIDVRGANATKGAWLVYPNPYHSPAGTNFNFWNYDASSQGWYIYGNGKVSSNGISVVPDPGVYIYQLTGAMVGGGGGPPPPCIVFCAGSGDPVDLATGLFTYRKTDIRLTDTIPVAVNRTYRTNDSVSRAFGIGATDDYDIYFTGNTFPYTYIELILANGSRIRFNRISSGTGYTDAVYTHTSEQDSFYGATIFWNNVTNNSWILQTKDGTQYQFPDSYNILNPRAAALTAIQDRYGNKVTLTRDSNGNLLQITSPNGRYIKLTYDASNRVTQAIDTLGRTVQYIYDASGRLQSVVDANNGHTAFTYDAQNNMLTIRDARGITYLTNEFDSAGRVIQQILGDSGTYLFDWTPTQNTSQTFSINDPNGASAGGVLSFRNCSNCSEGYAPPVAQVDVTDPGGYIRRVVFDTVGRVSTDTYALGQPEQQTFTYQYYADNTLKSETNGLGHRTNYIYDANLNLTEADKLAETSNPVTTTFTYEPKYNERTAFVDALNHSTTYAVDSQGNTTQITDANGNSTLLTYNNDGSVATISNGISGSVQFGYSGGDLVSIVDPLGNQVSRFTDAAGRMLSATDQEGHRTSYQYDGFDHITSVINPLGNATTFGYNSNGRLTAVTDSLNQTTSLTYDNMDRPLTITDPLNTVKSYVYGLRGELVDFVDGKGQVTSFSHDGLGRKILTGFGTQGSGGTLRYISTINYQYDNGNRMVQAIDSVAGTFTRTYDNLGHLLSEISPQGTVTYGYDAVGRRISMQVLGQSQLSYLYDNGNRPTQITEGSSTVSFGYDNANRRTSLTLPNGVSAAYSYDLDSHITGITYSLGSTVIGNLAYGYDSVGRRTSVGGSLAATGFPNPVTSATYNPDNQLTNWNGTTISYDANGNMVSDGTHSYTWDERNRLSSIDGGSTASFVYDPFGRRQSKTMFGITTAFLYDLVNPVQELSGTTPTANLLVGGLDKVFMRTDTTQQNFLTDAIGSTIALTDGTGAITSSYVYDAFGNVSTTGGGGNPIEYTGRENDGSGLYFYRSRYYNPRFQRFISKDPLGFGGGINLYAYVGNNPILFRDPFGRDKSGSCSSVCIAELGLGIGAIILTDGLAAPEVFDLEADLLTTGLETSDITTPYAVEVQSTTAEAQAALADVENGAQLYRMGELGENMAGESQYWSLENPLSNPDYANQMGLPGTNPNFVMSGTVNEGAGVVTNYAPGLGSNAGGGIQVVVTPGGVGNLTFTSF
jgi:RHS repeat-associated protein